MKEKYRNLSQNGVNFKKNGVVNGVVEKGENRCLYIVRLP
jgi:hypothetical protein